MKKILATCIVLFMAIFMTSCKKNEETVKVTDFPLDSVVEDLKLNDVKNGNSITEVDKSSKEYYDIKIASNKKDTLFTVVTNIDSIIKDNGDHFRSATVYPLTFTGELSDSIKSGIMNCVFSTAKLDNAMIGFEKELNMSTSWGLNVDVSRAVENYNNNIKNNQIAVVYIPTYVSYVKDGVELVSCYVMIPVYYEVTTSVVDKFYDVVVKDLVFNENNLLQSK